MKATMRRISNRGGGTITRTAVGVAALFVLMGAKGEGCMPGDDPGSEGEGGGIQPPIEEPCPPEGHVICPPGTYEELVCGPEGPHGPGPEGPGPEGPYEGLGGSCPAPEICGEPPPPPVEGEGCFSVCVPIEACGPGFHEEWICGEEPAPPHPEEPNPEEPPPPYPEEPNLEEPPPPPGECFPICVPNEEICPPGTFPATECDPYGECWETCHPFEEPCPPELVPTVECSEDGCHEVCVEPPEGEPGPEPPEGEPVPEPG